MNSNNKIAYVCNANCAKRYDTSPEQVHNLKDSLQVRGYDVRTRGCLSICDIVRNPTEDFIQKAIVNVELIDGENKRLLVAGMNENGNIGMMNPRASSRS